MLPTGTYDRATAKKAERSVMYKVLGQTWPLMLGVLLIMAGNGMQGTVVGLRGAVEGFDAATMSWVMAAYFLGFLGGARLTPRLIAGVGHVRVFAAMASLISAAFILYLVEPTPLTWAVIRLFVGFCFSGFYVVAESWLNATATNDTRGQVLSAYFIVQMIGVVGGQAAINLGDPGDISLFVLMSVLVSISVAPMLLLSGPAPAFQTTRPMPLRELFNASPLGVVGMCLMGVFFGCLYGMGPVYATEKGLPLATTTAFIAAVYLGGMVTQYPVGWVSDRMDRRLLIILISAAGAALTLVGTAFAGHDWVVIGLSAFLGGVSYPLYSLLIAHTNDFLAQDRMAGASSGLIFCYGLGAAVSPPLIGWLMTKAGADSFFVFGAGVLALVAGYGVVRARRRPAPKVDETGTYVALSPQISTVAVGLVQEASASDPQEV